MKDSQTALFRYGREVSSVFDLLGVKENDLTAALGYALAQSGRLREGLLTALGVPTSTACEIRLETAANETGRTDLEIEHEDVLVILEAKKGWNLPTEQQLSQYATRLLQSPRPSRLLVTLSDCSPEFAKGVLPRMIAGVPVRHLPWSEVKVLLRNAQASAGGHERFWLRQLDDYLRRAVRVRDVSDSWVYCVALSSSRPGNGGSRTFRDFVVNEDTYFHPVGKGWPPTPYNFMAFRWDNHVHQIRRVEHFEVINSIQDRWPDVPVDEETQRPHMLYDLGPPIPLAAPIPAGPEGAKVNYQASRLRVLLDRLLTSGSLQDALEASNALQVLADDP